MESPIAEGGMPNGQSPSQERTVHRWMCLGHFVGRSNQNARLPAMTWLMALSTELKKRAVRRLGELMADERKAGRLAKGAPGPGRGKKGAKAGLGRRTLSQRRGHAGISA